jgi:hypothetical protein
MERREMWSLWLERTLKVRDADDYAARQAERDRAYIRLRRGDAVAVSRDASDEVAQLEEMTDAA